MILKAGSLENLPRHVCSRKSPRLPCFTIAPFGMISTTSREQSYLWQSTENSKRSSVCEFLHIYIKYIFFLFMKMSVLSYIKIPDIIFYVLILKSAAATIINMPPHIPIINLLFSSSSSSLTQNLLSY